MTYNASGYIIFLIFIFFITIRVGWVFYKNGEVYLEMMLPNNEHLVSSINKMLLVGYYLLNLGYATVSISSWQTVTSSGELAYVLSQNAGTIILFLAVMHYFNLTWILLYSKHVDKKRRIKELLESK